jgi:sensor histidine kinase YesM
MAVRMGPRLRLTLDLPASLQKVPVPPLLLQPLVENAIRHGLEPQVDGGHITVRAQSAPEGLLLEVSDTGIGFDPGAPRAASADSSFGLAQVRERVATAYDGHGRVEVSSTPGSGTVIRIHLPLAPPNT